WWRTTMNDDWPDGYYREDRPQSSGSGNAGDPTVRMPYGGQGSRGQAPGGQDAAGWTSHGGQTWSRQDGGGQGWDGQDWNAQQTQREAPGPGFPQQPPRTTGQPPRRYGRRSGWRRPGRWIRLIAMLIVLVLIAGVGLYFYLNSKLTRENVLVNYTGRPAASAGTNWLIAGSDSRQGLTRAQERKYSTGRDISGSRSDTVMLLHISANGTPDVLVSLPRDSYVDIPGHGFNKLNAAFSFGGPQLLAETVQNATGLRIDHFMDIGFGGFVNVVNAVGGVTMCLPSPLKDQASGLNLKAGCQSLSGGEALSYVRDRHDFADQDLQRIQDQRLFLKALLSKLTSTGTMLNPFASVPAAFGVADTLTVDQGTQLYQLAQAAFAMRSPKTTTVPIANANYETSAGDAVLWDRSQARELFNDLGTDHAIPKSLLSGSALSGQT
ncbi:MAG TPA: LCP family protein, partial [Streptosporangiaceae bacterium]|nr:LCP family protein [Streptosporangiaceae bacterium]